MAAHKAKAEADEASKSEQQKLQDKIAKLESEKQAEVTARAGIWVVR